MPQILVNCRVPMRQGDVNGPQFHRWLPNGELDRIVFASESEGSLSLWFERRGSVEREFIHYDRERQEVDPAVLRQEGRVEGGTLYGQVSLNDVPNAVCEAMRE